MPDNIVKRVSTVFTIKDDGVSKSLSDINKQMKSTQADIKLAGERLKAFGGASDDLKYQQEALAKQISNVKDKISIYNKSIEETTAKLSKNKDELVELGNKKDDVNHKYQEAVKVYGAESQEAEKLRGELNNLKEAYKEKEKVINQNINAINNHTADSKKAEAEFVKLQHELEKTNIELATNESGWIKTGKALESTGQKMTKFGNKVSSAGNSLTVGVTLPLLAIGTAATKMAMDAVESENLFEVSMGNMAEAARKWSDETAKSLGLNAYELRKNVGTFNAMLLSMGQSEKGAYDMSTAITKLAYDMASFYNLDPGTAFEKIRAGISGEAEPLKQLGIIINETAVKAYGLEHGLIRQVPVLDKFGKAVKDAFGKVKMKTEEMDEATKVQARYGLIMELTAKAQGDLARTLDSPTNKLRLQTERIKQQAIELGTRLIPILEKGMNILDKVLDWYESLNDEQKDMVVKLGLTAMAAGPLLSIGGKFISIGGSLVGTVGKISTALGTAKVATAAAGTAAASAGGAGGLGALAGGLGTVALAAAPYLVAAAAVGAAGYLVYKGLTKEVVPAVDLFADKVVYTTKAMENMDGRGSKAVQKTMVEISEATAKAVGSYVELDDKVKEYLNNLYLNSTTITEKIKVDTIAKFSEMKNQVIKGYEEQKNETIKKLQEMFLTSKSLTELEQQQLLESTSEFYTSKTKATEEYEKQIDDIIIKASNEKRAITDQETKDILALQSKMRVEAVNALSQNELEVQVILQRMKDYDKRITAEQAAEHIKKLNESRDKAVTTANDEYEKRIALVEKLKSEGIIKSQEQADRMIAEAKRQRDGIVDSAEETRLGALEKMRNLNSDLDKEVDTMTGKLLTWWDKLKRWWSGWQPETKNFTYTTSGSSGGYTPYTPNPGNDFTKHALGTNYFQGGLAYTDEKGFELKSYPRGSKIFNHEASERYIEKATEALVKGLLSDINASSGAKTIIVPVNLDGREIARITAPYSEQELGFRQKGARISYRRG